MEVTQNSFEGSCNEKGHNILIVHGVLLFCLKKEISCTIFGLSAVEVHTKRSISVKCKEKDVVLFFILIIAQNTESN